MSFNDYVAFIEVFGKDLIKLSYCRGYKSKSNIFNISNSYFMLDGAVLELIYEYAGPYQIEKYYLSKYLPEYIPNLIITFLYDLDEKRFYGSNRRIEYKIVNGYIIYNTQHGIYKQYLIPNIKAIDGICLPGGFGVRS